MSKRRWTNEEILEYRKEHVGFYANREDSRVFVPKAFGYGITINWANPWSWVALAAILAAIVLIKAFGITL